MSGQATVKTEPSTAPPSVQSDRTARKTAPASTGTNLSMPSSIAVPTHQPLGEAADQPHRAVHRIRLSALSHNFSCVEQAASAQKCSVIAVVKADGYGHGALATALHLADASGAEAFAVATLEEAIALRQAFALNPVGQPWSASVSLPPRRRNLRPSFVRILVLGPPVGFPRCFDEYYHHNIEVMVSGPEVAAALMQWIANEPQRKEIMVQRAAQDAKSLALTANKDASRSSSPLQRFSHSTLSTVSGQDLAKEVRSLLLTQQLKQREPNNESPPPSEAFGGLEAAAMQSRNRAEAVAKAESIIDEDVDDDEVVVKAKPPPSKLRRLRWHALVDTGMGRLGFQASDTKQTVEKLRELVDAQIHNNAPIEFTGMVTHMADASSTSTYTHEQIDRFLKLLKAVREAKIMIPNLSTDNSAALLTTSLTHFQPETILAQAHADTRGFVRVGGALYGQRPAFSQLRSVSTLLASVRHVAILKQGESVGYDRAYVAQYNVRIATLTAGFADGYPRALGNGEGHVQIRGSVFPVAGNVCMDMMMVELGPAEDREGVGASVCVGDTAVLWGPLDEDDEEGLVRLQDIAAKLKTTQSALTCGLDKVRVRREYV